MAAPVSFSSLLLEISDSLSADQLERLKFLCSPDIGKRELERCMTGHRLFQTLGERGKLGPENTEFLGRLLEQIQRRDLRERLERFTEGGEEERGERDALDLAAEVLSETLGLNWRRLGRRLGLSEVKLDSISRKHPSDLEETAVEVVKVWRRSREERSKDPESVRELVRALRGCQLNMTADTLEDRLGL